MEKKKEANNKQRQTSNNNKKTTSLTDRSNMIGLLNLPRGSTNYAIGASSYLIIPGVWTFKFFKIKNLKTNF